jgi:hypothetical protein
VTESTISPGRTISLGGHRYPVVLPSIRDPRLGIAAVVLSLHALGQLGLHWPLSVPQILAAILTCAVLEVAITFARRRIIVWPASALLTGSAGTTGIAWPPAPGQLHRPVAFEINTAQRVLMRVP